MKRKTIPAFLVIVSLISSSCATKPTTTSAASTAMTGNRQPSAICKNGDETPWTTWSRDNGEICGLLVLSHIRKNLLENSLDDPHLNYSSYRQINCDKTNKNFRSADGTCNDLEKPLAGAAGVAFGRNVKPEFIDLNASKRVMSPPPAQVSKVFFTRDEFKPVPFLNMLAAVWIQFMNHDWLTHGRNMEENPYQNSATGGMKVERTKKIPADMRGMYRKEYGSKVTANEVTHWWDASQIYGSSLKDQMKIRFMYEGKHDGKIATSNYQGRELLPFDHTMNVADNKQNQGLEITGFRDNWWMGLSMLHTLFVMEHNAIADMLFKSHVTQNSMVIDGKKWLWENNYHQQVPMTDAELDEQIFQTARLINAAVLAKIHTVEWTPAILNNPTLKKAMCTNWYGLLNSKCSGKTDWFQFIDLGYVFGGIVGSTTNNYKTPFSITEEFTSVYRLHSLLPENIELRTLAGKDKIEPIPFLDTRNDKSYAIMQTHDLKDLYYSFGRQLPGQLVLNDFPKFMQNLTVPGHDSMDLGMVDIIRDRERGVPRYNQFRRGISLKPITKYADFFQGGEAKDERQKKILQNFYDVYGRTADGKDNVEDVDLLVGTLAEEVRPESFGFGETMFQIFILMASRRLMADRFFTNDYTPAVYTQEGIDWVDYQGTFAQVIARHMPELKNKMSGLDTAFRPWKE